MVQSWEILMDVMKALGSEVTMESSRVGTKVADWDTHWADLWGMNSGGQKESSMAVRWVSAKVVQMVAVMAANLVVK
jgi:hypothetical protein